MTKRSLLETTTKQLNVRTNFYDKGVLDMSITNVKPITRCPNCLTHGVVRRKEKSKVAMECPECGVEWKTDSLICTDCGEPNGYVIEGPCMACYAQKYKSS